MDEAHVDKVQQSPYKCFGVRPNGCRHRRSAVANPKMSRNTNTPVCCAQTDHGNCVVFTEEDEVI